ncbi:hypothetical protein CIHG_08645 [Coccidioides immitis H538.4]|uniref:Uncharacterized protein n=3 Tax=Coccidioides immitis TaxID=5501 RepID=A0A0J8RC02_COCIT|nr:hypothetical protein CIRG_09844 [Coccidioides immitis RMSCC 2394]KMU81428.1 hypothetical protein CISG_09141 [Coccidioides immitis RMSCC 3703]KMU90841.1 hypothetical protein CIHG_08645 [Coccidioides immitis H538.4]
MPARNQIENITPSSTPVRRESLVHSQDLVTSPFSDPNQSLPSLSSCSRDCLASRPITSGAWFGMWFRSSEPDTTPKDDMPYCENIDSRHVAQTRGLSMRAIPSPCRTVGIIDDHHYRGEGQLRISSAVYALAFAKFSCFSCRVSCIDDLECHRNNAPTREPGYPNPKLYTELTENPGFSGEFTSWEYLNLDTNGKIES